MDPNVKIDRVFSMLIDALNDPAIGNQPLVGIGVGVPSPVIDSEPNRLSSMILPKWAGYDLQGAIEKEFGVPVLMENDANLGALAEHWWGAGRGEPHMVYLKLATGIGAGIIIAGEVFRGRAGIAGEIAHTVVEPGGPRCVCGQDGCLGVVSGSSMLLQRVREKILAGRRTSLHPDDLTTRALVDAAQAGDALATETVERAGHLLGIGIANLLNVLDPGMVVLGGELTYAGAILLEPLVQTTHARALSTSIAPIRIVTTELGERDIALGAATQVLSAALKDESMLIGARPVARAGGVPA
ncbi:MAG: ROK family protein [Myxococcota bacterium]